MIRLLLLLIFFPIAHACDVEGEGDVLYSRYYEIVYKDTGRDKAGQNTAEVRALDKGQAKLAHSCLIKAAEKNSCSAHYVLSLYYQHGNLGSSLPITKNEELAKQYRDSTKVYCSENT